MNRDHSGIFEIASKYCISDSFVDYDDYSISSRGFSPTVVKLKVKADHLIRFVVNGVVLSSTWEQYCFSLENNIMFEDEQYSWNLPDRYKQ